MQIFYIEFIYLSSCSIERDIDNGYHIIHLLFVEDEKIEREKKIEDLDIEIRIKSPNSIIYLLF